MVAQQLAHALVHALQAGAPLRLIFLVALVRLRAWGGSDCQRTIARESVAYLQDQQEAVVLPGRSGEALLHAVNEGLGILHVELGLLLPVLLPLSLARAFLGSVLRCFSHLASALLQQPHALLAGLLVLLLSSLISRWSVPRVEPIGPVALVATFGADEDHFLDRSLDAVNALKLVDVDAASVKPILAIVALNHERIVVLAATDTVGFQGLLQPIHQFAVCEVHFNLAGLFLQLFQDRNPVRLPAIDRGLDFISPSPQFPI